MRVAVQGLGTVPTTVLIVLEQKKPDVCYVICSDYEMNHVAKEAGFEKPNRELVKEKAEKLGTKIEFKLCDVFDPVSVGNVVGEILNKLNPKEDEVVVN